MDLKFSKAAQVGRPRKRKKNRDPDSIPALDAKLWKLFSKFIRRRDSDPHTGIGFCITCGAPRNWKGADAGHFIGRQHKGTKFDERNVHLQCKPCNKWGHGEQALYAIEIDKRYGKGTADYLEKIGKGRGTKLDRMWYRHMIEVYTDKLAKMDEKPKVSEPHKERDENG